jgi:hypothetical protein
MMCSAIDNPARCEIRPIVSILRSRNMSATKIQRELCMAVYDRNVMSKGITRQWCEYSKIGEKMFTMKSKVIGHLK